jgi:Tfp pilus assembly protein PilX
VQLLSRVRDERGFTMIIVLMVLMVASLMATAAFETVRRDNVAGRYAGDTKQAYAAAQAGLAWYQSQLAKDPTYWAQCASVPTVSGHAAPVWDGRASTTRVWADVNDQTLSWTGITPPAATTAAHQIYDVELVPASGQTACDTTNPDGSMVDSTTNTFRVRVTGRYNTASRALIATFRRKGFLDYLYYTKYETLDSALAANAVGRPTSKFDTQDNEVPPKTFTDWSAANCNKEFWPAGTGRLSSASPFTPRTYPGGQYKLTTSGPPWTTFNPAPPCTDVQFITGDAINGPLHTQDSLLVCGTPTFGVTTADKIEVEAPASLAVRDAKNEKDPSNNSYWGCNQTLGTNAQLFKGTLVTSADAIEPPQDNSALASAVSPCCRFLGKTVITFNTTGTYGSINVKNQYMGFPAAGKNIALPPNAVIYASTPTGATCSPYDPLNTDASEDTCGEVRVQGSVETSVTVGADQDIVVTGNLQNDPAAPNALIGLIAQGYVRIWHPVTASSPNNSTAQWFGTASGSAVFNSSGNCTSTNTAGFPTGITIKAAILALRHSFVVDNWRCGAQLTGKLNVTGAIAQLYRGPVGTASGPNGYPKNYAYDTRLKYRSPPNFLSPVQAAWRLMRVQEQTGSAGISSAAP